MNSFIIGSVLMMKRNQNLTVFSLERFPYYYEIQLKCPMTYAVMTDTLKSRQNQSKIVRRKIEFYRNELKMHQSSDLRTIQFISKRFWEISQISDHYIDSLADIQNIRFLNNMDHTKRMLAHKKQQDVLKSVQIRARRNSLAKSYKKIKLPS